MKKATKKISASSLTTSLKNIQDETNKLNKQASLIEASLNDQEAGLNVVASLNNELDAVEAEESPKLAQMLINHLNELDEINEGK